MAVATEQEMRARVVDAEAQVPLALADALRNGRLGVMDYYRMENMQSDTRMRSSIAGEEPSPRFSVIAQGRRLCYARFSARWSCRQWGARIAPPRTSSSTSSKPEDHRGPQTRKTTSVPVPVPQSQFRGISTVRGPAIQPRRASARTAPSPAPNKFEIVRLLRSANGVRQALVLGEITSNPIPARVAGIAAVNSVSEPYCKHR